MFSVGHLFGLHELCRVITWGEGESWVTFRILCCHGLFIQTWEMALQVWNELSWGAFCCNFKSQARICTLSTQIPEVIYPSAKLRTKTKCFGFWHSINIWTYFKHLHFICQNVLTNLGRGYMTITQSWKDLHKVPVICHIANPLPDFSLFINYETYMWNSISLVSLF